MSFRWPCAFMIILLFLLGNNAGFSAETSPRGPENVSPSGVPLHLADAIRLAVQNNLTTQLAKANAQQIRGEILRAASALLPSITGTVQQTRVFKENLEALGFSFPPSSGFPTLIGPFNTFDARLQLVQNLLNFKALWATQASRTGERIAQNQEHLAREQVAAAAALSYLEAQRTRRAVDTARADVQLSQSLLKQAHDQHAAGVSTGIDVARAETDAAQENLRLIRAQVDAANAELRLKRVVGLALDQPLTLDNFPSTVDLSPLPAAEKVVGEAAQSRVEIQIADEIYQESLYQLKSAEADYLPTLTANADYGYSGTTPGNTARTGSIGGRLQLPILSGGDTRGAVVEARASAQQYQERSRDTRVQVEEDARLSLQGLSAAVEETRTANQAVDLAQKELKMARDRFAAGIGDNIQVLSAQTALAGALDDQVNAFAHYETARVNMATALGQVEDFQ